MTKLSKGDLIINTDAASSSGKDSFSTNDLLKNLENYDPNKQCVNGLKTKVSWHVGDAVNALNQQSLHNMFFNGVGVWGN